MPGNPKSPIVAKIMKLLQLSKSANEHEAAAAAAKAQELLSKHNLALSDIETEDEPLKAQEVHQKTRQRLEDWAHALAGSTAGAFDCEYYHRSDGQTVFVGVGIDAEVCGWTYGYLYKTLLRLASSYLRSPACSRLRLSLSRKIARESFLLGALAVVKTKLAQQKKDTPITPGALVPVKEALVKAAMPDSIIPGACRFGYVRDIDFVAGMQAGRGVSLSAPIQGAKAAQSLSA
ncbi:DUF2786 domain-containing protein [Desulfovibrio sp. OttesenSCG-928-G15]|nr:DUF2786 domain-containing protein [Desulfovibrio sp. OttesenSCG-928-G15]